MPSYLLDKTLNFESEIEKVDSVIIDDHFTYITLYEGIRVQGVINISGLGHYENEEYPFSTNVDVDILCPNDQICSARGFSLRVEDSSYEIADHAVIFHIKCVLEGTEKVEECFALEEASEKAYLELEEAPLEVAFNAARSLLSEEDASRLESLLSDDSVEVISTMDHTSFNSGTLDFIKDELDPLTSFPSEETPLMSKEEVIVDDENQARKEEQEERISKGQHEENKTPQEKWFKEEPMVIISSFYRVKKGDTYQSIATKHQLNEEQLFLANKGQELKEGMLIRIKR